MVKTIIAWSIVALMITAPTAFTIAVIHFAIKFWQLPQGDSRRNNRQRISTHGGIYERTKRAG